MRRSTAFLAAEKNHSAQPQHHPGGCPIPPPILPRTPQSMTGEVEGCSRANRSRMGPPGPHLGGAGGRSPVPVQCVKLLVELVVELGVAFPRVHHLLRGESRARGRRHPARPRTPRRTPPFPIPLSPAHPLHFPRAPPNPGQRMQASGRAHRNAPAGRWRFNHESMLVIAWYKNSSELGRCFADSEPEGTRDKGGSVTRWHPIPRRAPVIPAATAGLTSKSRSEYRNLFLWQGTRRARSRGRRWGRQGKGFLPVRHAAGSRVGWGEAHASPKPCHLRGAEPGWRQRGSRPSWGMRGLSTALLG